MAQLPENVSYDSLNEKEKRELERIRIIKNMLYEYNQAELKRSIEEMSRKTEKYIKIVFQQASEALETLNWRDITKIHFACDYPLKKEAAVLDEFTAVLHGFDEKEKDASFKRMNDCAQKAKEEVKNMENKGGMKSDRDWNMMRQRFSDLAGACKDFNNPTDKDAYRNESSKQKVAAMEEHARRQKLELNKAQDKQVEDFNTKMRKLVEIYTKTFEAKTRLEESGVLPKADGKKSTDAYQLSPKGIGDTLVSLIKMHKEANDLRCEEINGIDEINEQIMEYSKNILNYFEAHKSAKAECGLTAEQLTMARDVVEKHYQVKVVNKVVKKI